METILPYLINAIFGGGGGWLGSLIKKNGLGMVGNLLSGAVGGSILPKLAAMTGLLGGGAVDAAATASASSFDIPTIITALVGGSAGSLIGGMFKKAA